MIEYQDILSANESGYFTLDQLSDMVGRAGKTIARKSGVKEAKIGAVILENSKKPAGIYSATKVLALYNIDATKALINIKGNRLASSDQSPHVETKKSPRADRNLIRVPKAFSQLQRNNLEKYINNHAKQHYFAMTEANLTQAVLDAVLDWLSENDFKIPADWQRPEEMAEFYRKRRLERKDSSFVGEYKKENWKGLHNKKWSSKEKSKGESKLWYNFINIYKNAGLLGKNYGAGKLWFVDGTTFDAYVKLDGKNVRINYAVVTCGLTGFVIAVKPLKSESTDTMIDLLSEAYARVGVPEWGIVVDNGSAFRSRKFKNFAKSLFSPHQLEHFRTDFHRKMFPGQKFAPLIFPPPHTPTFPIKAFGERNFREINKAPIQRPELARSWQSSIDRRVRIQKGESLKYLHDNALEATEAWEIFNGFIYNELHFKARQKSAMFRGIRELTKENGDKIIYDVHNFFKYLGGFDKDNVAEFDEENFYKVFYWQAKEKYIHRINSSNLIKDGTVVVTHAGVTRNYYCENLSMKFLNKPITVVVNPENENYACMYIEHDENSYDEFTPDPDDIYCIGIAFDATVNSVDDLWMRDALKKNRQKSQEIMQKLNIDEALELRKKRLMEREQRHTERLKETALLPHRIDDVEFEAPSEDIHDNLDKTKEIKIQNSETQESLVDDDFKIIESLF